MSSRGHSKSTNKTAQFLRLQVMQTVILRDVNMKYSVILRGFTGETQIRKNSYEKFHSKFRSQFPGVSFPM
jgi:hypothetical protein